MRSMLWPRPQRDCKCPVRNRWWCPLGLLAPSHRHIPWNRRARPARAGSARLGMMAALDASTDMLGKPLIEREIHPNKDLSNAFDEGFACFKAAQAATRGLT